MISPNTQEIKLNSMAILAAIFGGALCVTGAINAAKLTYYDTSSGYRESWGMYADWFVKAREEGWLRDGCKSNLRSALIGATLFAIGMGIYFWNGSSVSVRGQDFTLLVSSLMFIIGVAGRSFEDNYSVGMKTARWAGATGVLVSLSMIFGS